jgi:hypothetical protein
VIAGVSSSTAVRPGTVVNALTIDRASPITRARSDRSAHGKHGEIPWHVGCETRRAVRSTTLYALLFLVALAPLSATAQSSSTDTADEAEEEETSSAEGTLPSAPAEEEEAAAPAAAPRPYRGSIFYWQHGLTVNTLSPSAQLTYNPTYYWYFLLQPRWYLDAQNFLVLSQGLSIEFTEADWTTTQYEPQLADTVLEWRHTEMVEGFVFITSARLAAPTSLQSIGAERIINTGVGLTAVRVVPEAASLTFALSVGYRHWWAASNVMSRNAAPQYCAADCGPSTERDRFSSVLTVNITPFAGFTATMQYALVAMYGHDLAPVSPGAVGGPSTIPDMSDTHWRGFQYWAVAVAYDVVPWLNLALGYQSASSLSPLWNDDGSVRNPFYNPDSELYLAATIAIDALVEEIEGSEDDASPELRQRRRQGLASAGRSLSF